jgi:hypothetical protein
MSSNHIETRPLDEWFAPTLNGDIALCDPFSGEPLCGPHIALEPKQPTEAFVEDFKLGNGFGYWRGSKYHDIVPYVGVYLTDPSRPEGLGDYQEFKELAGDFDVVVHSEMQSVRMQEIRRLSGGVGKIALQDGTETNATYLSALMDSHSLVLDLAPAIDLLTGEPIDRAGKALQAVRDTVVAQGIDQKDPNDPDLTYLATDYVYANTLQWHQSMSAGSVAENYFAQHGRPLTTMLVVAGHEHGDLGRKLVVSGLPADRIDVAFARPEYAEDVNTRSYAVALDAGYIPHEALRGAEY